MALVRRRVLLGAAAASQCGSLGCERRPWCCLPDLFEDRSVSRRHPRPGADRLGDRDGGAGGQRDVSPLPGGRQGGRDQLAGLALLLRCPLGRGGPCRFDTAAPAAIRRCAACGGRSLWSIFRTRSRSHSKSRFTKPGDAGGSGRSAAMASARARSESVRVRRLPGRPVSVNSSKRSPVRRHAALEAPGNLCSASRTTRCSQVAARRRSRLRPAALCARSMSIGVAVRGQDGLRSASAVNSAASPPGAANSSRRRETRLRSASAGARASSRSAVLTHPSPLPSC